VTFRLYHHEFNGPRLICLVFPPVYLHTTKSGIYHPLKHVPDIKETGIICYLNVLRYPARGYKTGMNHFTGLILGVTVIAGIWGGHVLVRRVEYYSVDLRMPVTFFFITGIGLAGLSVLSKPDWLSGILGIMGIILFWNGIETRHQEKRVKKGYAPANPANPRHQQILQEFPNATTEVLLKHDHSIGKEGHS